MKGRDGEGLLFLILLILYPRTVSAKRKIIPFLITTIDAFERAAKRNPAAGKFWLNRLSEISEDDVQAIFRMIPKSEISDLAIEFAQTMLKLNKPRLLAIGAKLQ